MVSCELISFFAEIVFLFSGNKFWGTAVPFSICLYYWSKNPSVSCQCHGCPTPILHQKSSSCEPNTYNYYLQPLCGSLSLSLPLYLSVIKTIFSSPPTNRTFLHYSRDLNAKLEQIFPNQLPTARLLPKCDWLIALATFYCVPFFPSSFVNQR